MLVKLVGPFVFPAAGAGGCDRASPARAPQWEVELAGMVGYVALGLAYLTAGSGG